MYHSLIGKPSLRVVLVMGLLIGLCSLLLLAACGGDNSAKGGGGGEVANKPQQEPAEEKQAQQPAGKGQQQREQEPEPQPAPEPPRPGHQPITLAGTQSTMQTRSFQLESGLAVCKMTHQGQGDFIVNLLLLEDLDKQGKRVEYGFPEFGKTSVSSAVSIAPTGRYILKVEADGPWEVTIEQPRPSSAPQMTSFSGSDTDVTPLFELSSGLKRVSMTHERYGHFIVHLLDKEGLAVAWGLGNDYGPAKMSSTVTIPQDDIYLFMVEADGPWTIDVE